MTRRGFLAAVPAALALAGTREDVLEAIAPLASALAEGDPGAFMQHIPKNAEGRTELERNVRALIEQAETTSSVEIAKLSENGTAELDWLMQIRSRHTGMLVERRRGVVRVRVDGRRLVAIGPAGFFAPPRAG